MIERFREIDDEVKSAIAKETSKLKLGMCVLTLAQDQFETDYLSADEIVEALDRLGVAVERSNLLKAFARAGDKIRCITKDGIKKFKVMTLGRQEVEEILSVSGPQVIYVEDGQPRTARARLAEILATLNGEVRICDPYYGAHSLDVLQMIPSSCEVHFLTARTNEKTNKLHREISDFKNEYPHIKLRAYPKPVELHDRYLIDQNRLWLLGHGIKDIGNKESFIIQIDAQVASELIDNLRSVFDQRWSKANPI